MLQQNEIKIHIPGFTPLDKFVFLAGWGKRNKYLFYMTFAVVYYKHAWKKL